MFPKLKLSQSDRIWLKEIYRGFKTGQQITSRVLKVKLLNKLSKNFDPKDIDPRLLRDEKNITLFGILHIDPKTDLIGKCDKFIRTIREQIIENPETDQIKMDKISKATNVPQNELRKVLDKISDLGHFWSSSSHDPNNEVVGFGVGDDRVFDEYLKYEGLEKLIIKFFKKYDPQRTEISTSVFSMPRSLVSKRRFTQTIAQRNKSQIDFNPIFSSRISQIDKKLCFVLMPFSKDWSDRVYRDLIRTNVEKLNLQCLRADNLTGQIVIEDIWTKINQCSFIIADVTNRNPNVMYELGIVHTIGKPAILITQNLSDIPFDFGHLRHFEYQDNTDGFRKVSKKLPQVIKDIYSDYYSVDLDLISNV